MEHDKILVDRWAARRDAEAFNEIVNRHINMVYATCMRVLGNAAEAEDITQECFLRLAEKPPAIRTSLGGWLHRLATHRSLNAVKSVSRRRAREQRFAEERPPSTEMRWNDIKAILDEEIDNLPEKQRVVIVAHFLERKTHESIAQELGLTRPAISQRIQNGVESLREALKRHGIETLAAPLAAMLLSETTEAAPSTVAMELGRHALAGVGKPVAPVPASTFSWPLVAKACAAVALLAVATGAAWLLFPRTPQPKRPVRQVRPVSRPAPAVAPPAAPQVTEAELLENAPIFDIPEPIPGKVAFRCVDRTGAPIPEAQVCFTHRVSEELPEFSPEQREIDAQGPLSTDAEGLVWFDDEPNAPDEPSTIFHNFRNVFAWLPGKLVGIWQFPPAMTPGGHCFAPTEPVKVVMIESVTLKGAVHVPRGHSPVEVAVRVMTVNANAGTRFGADFSVYSEDYWPELFRTRPDTAGNFEIRNVPTAGHLFLSATAPELAEAQFATHTPGSTGAITLSLPAEGVIEGTLRAPPGMSPRPDALVFARCWGTRNRVAHRFEAKVEANGTFKISGLPKGEFMVTAQPRTNPAPWTSRPVDKVMVEPGHTTGGVELLLERGAILEGTVRGLPGSEPLPDAHLGARSPSEGYGETVAATFTDENGHYTLRLPAGDLALTCSAGIGFRHQRITIEVEPGATTLEDRDFLLLPGKKVNLMPPKATISGRVVDAQGRPLPGVTITDQPISRQREDGRVTGGNRLGLTDKDGRYQVSVDAQSQRRIQAGGGPHSTAGSEWFSPGEGQTIDVPDLVVEPLSNVLSGQVLNDDGNPVEGASVNITGHGFEWLNLPPQTDAEGRFFLDHMPDHEVQVSITKNGYRGTHRLLVPGADFTFVIAPLSEKDLERLGMTR